MTDANKKMTYWPHFAKFVIREKKKPADIRLRMTTYCSTSGTIRSTVAEAQLDHSSSMSSTVLL